LTATLQAVAGSATFSAGSTSAEDSGAKDTSGFSSLQDDLARKQQQQQQQGGKTPSNAGWQQLLQQAGMAGQEWQRAACAVLSMRGLGWGWWQIVEEVVQA
jgi:hypothetical protein